MALLGLAVKEVVPRGPVMMDSSAQVVVRSWTVNKQVGGYYKVNASELENLRMRLDDGVHPILMTPFRQDESLDLDALRAQINWLMEKDKQGCISAFLICGANGEFFSMTDEERDLIIRTCVEEVRGRVPVVAGTINPTTALTIRASKRAQDLGAGCVMVTNPYYCSPTAEGAFKHHVRIAEALDIGVMIYNNGVYTNFFLSRDMLYQLSGIENVVATKDVCFDVQEFYVRSKLVGHNLAYVDAIGDLHFASVTLLTGRRAFFSNICLYAPELSFELCLRARQRDAEGIAAVMRRMAPLLQVYQKVAPSDFRTGGGMVYLSLIKEAMNYRGIRAGICRSPLQPLTAEVRRELHAAIEQLDLPRV